MAIKDVIKVSRKTFINPRAWLGYDTLKDESRTMFQAIKPIFIPPKINPEREETFEAAKERLNLTEEEIQQVGRTYLLFAGIFALLGIGLFALGIVLLFDVEAHIAGFILAVCFTVLVFAQAFKYHFWYFQIKHHKLGCTFEDWRNGKPKNEG